ncbi:tetratricopeptide repeat protein 23 isoform X2 [Triplophysa dalaica]|uniref:tetratricopeptide repeat protein 23 isoform X2 n=1 Tax=Triplophysa dalaica TaxID=1582913 RepID=UPI0024DF49A4|nr:tetratricopeptide repeat protein 23 isoform X2 [Triplophysa dalaica]
MSLASQSGLFCASQQSCESGLDDDPLTRLNMNSSASSGGSLQEADSTIVSQKEDDVKSYSMMTPAEKLSVCERRMQSLADREEYDGCIKELVRCLALSRLVYGNEHFAVVQAQSRLAKAYLQYKGWPHQAEEHASQALEVLGSNQQGERVSYLKCCLSAHQTLGSATLFLGNLAKAESSFQEARGIMGDIVAIEAILDTDRLDTEYEISTNLARVYQRQGRAEEALSQCEKALELQRDGGQLSRNCLIYRNMAAIEQTQGRLDRAIEHLLQSQSPGGLEEAHTAHSLALAYSSTSEPQHNDSAAQYFEESISVYKSALGPRDGLTLSVQDDYSHFLLLTGQQEKSAQIQRESLALKKSTFGELSAEMTEALQLIGGVEMTQGQMRQAHRTLRKCLDIQIMLYGPQHKKTKATQRTVDMLFQSPEVHGSRKTESQLETRPPFCAVVSSPTELKSSISNL